MHCSVDGWGAQSTWNFDMVVDSVDGLRFFYLQAFDFIQKHGKVPFTST
jgi:hypothetical protein